VKRSERARVLAIDDAPMVLEALCLLFEGEELATASSVEEGLKKLEADPSLRIVLLDLSMPQGGVPLIKTLQRRFPERVVIVLSGDAGAIEPAAKKLGVFRCIDKGDASYEVLDGAVREAREFLQSREC
jgi:DNA-binding NarL/FixJ family response regulator